MTVIKFVWHLFLFLIAWVLFLMLSIINYVVVLFKGGAKGYFLSSAVSIDKFGNREFRSLWNATLRKSNGYEFGKENETISSALGKNKRDGTMSITGKVLDFILDIFEKNHSIKSIK